MDKFREMTIRGKYIRLLRRTKRNIFVCISIIAYGLFTLWSQTLEPFRQHDTISCHYLRDNSSLPVLERHLNLPPRSIFFHATSCTGNLTSRQHCAIESAARTHREWQINVVFSGPTFLKNYLHLKNVKLWRIHIEEFSKGTPFEEYIDRGVFKTCRWNAELSTDLLKYLTLATWGGIYLDLDIVVARPLGSLARNWATRDDEGVIADSVLAISRDSFGKNVSQIAVKEMLSILKKGDCGNRGPPVITRVLRTYCTTTDTAYMSSATCNGITAAQEELAREAWNEGLLRRVPVVGRVVSWWAPPAPPAGRRLLLANGMLQTTEDIYRCVQKKEKEEPARAHSPTRQTQPDDQ